MKGLILKDLYNMRNYGKSLGIVFGMMAIFGIVLKNPAYVSAMMIFLALNASLSLMALDEQVKWDQYALTLPVNKNLIVKEKLLLSTLFTIAGGTLSMVVGVILTNVFGGDQGLLIKCTVVGIYFILLVLAFLIPVIFKYGVEKGRFIMIASVLVPVVVFVMAMKYLEGSEIPITEEMFMSALNGATVIGIVVVIAALIVSYRVSIQVYKNKEW